MKVYRIAPNVAYSGGSALVAANDVQQAINLYCEDSFRCFKYTECTCTCNIVVGLDYDTIVPQVMFDDVYLE